MSITTVARTDRTICSARTGRGAGVRSLIAIVTAFAALSPVVEAHAAPRSEHTSGAYAAAPSATQLTPVVPARVLDTRNGIGAPATKLTPGSTVELTVTGGTTNVPTDASAVVLNVTATEADNNGFITVWPCGTTRPNASNLNVTTGQTIPNLVIAKVGNNGKVCLYTQPGTHLLADLNAFWGNPPLAEIPVKTTPGAVQQSTGGNPTGTAAVTGSPAATGNIDFDPDTEAATPSVDVLPPSAAQAQAAPSLAGVQSVTPSMQQQRTESSTHVEMIANEPVYSIGSAGYVSSVDKAIGRVVMWKLTTSGWVRANSCSGTVVGVNLVLTAGHCLKGGWDAYSFLPGLVGNSAPLGEWFANGNRAWAHQLYFDLSAARANAQVVLDYAFIKFDPDNNNGLSLSAATGSFQIAMQPNLVGHDLYVVGYPAEGYYSSLNNGYCMPNGVTCYPYHCSSRGAGAADFSNGWAMVGFGCNANGGISGGAVFSQLEGKWYVVSMFDYGGYIMDRNNLICEERTACSWYMANAWGPEFRQGWLDSLYQFAANA